MKYGRIDHEGLATWVRIDGDVAMLLDGAPYDLHEETGQHVPMSTVRLLAPVVPTKIVCVGRNYAAHIQEMGYAADGVPSVFLKPVDTIVGPDDVVVLPPTSLSDEVEHEAELAVVMSKPATEIAEADVDDHVFGYTCADDVSARDIQRTDPNNTRAKGFNTFCPIGPVIDTDVRPESGLHVRSRVNGEARQDGSTLQMMRSVREIVSFISQFTTLHPGDVVLTGSPGGSGSLVTGDTVEIDIQGIGVLRHGVVAHS